MSSWRDIFPSGVKAALELESSSGSWGAALLSSLGGVAAVVSVTAEGAVVTGLETVAGAVVTGFEGSVLSLGFTVVTASDRFPALSSA